jgi:hypothetical protein
MFSDDNQLRYDDIDDEYPNDDEDVIDAEWSDGSNEG